MYNVNCSEAAGTQSAHGYSTVPVLFEYELYDYYTNAVCGQGNINEVWKLNYNLIEN